MFSPGASISGAASGQIWGPKLRWGIGRGQKTALCRPQGISEQVEAEQGPWCPRRTWGHISPGAATRAGPSEGWLEQGNSDK